MLNINNIYNLSLSWIIFTATVPFVFYLAIPNHPYKYLVAAGIILMSVRFVIRNKIKIEDPIIIGILIIQSAYAFVASILHELFFLGFETLYINMVIQYISVMVVYLYITTFYSILRIGKSTVYAMAIMGITGAFAFILCAAGLLNVASEWANPDDTIGFNFMLTFSKGAYFLAEAIIIRVSGFFDEPGTFAFYITFALLTNRLNNYSYKLEILLIITGLFTLSIAFYITIALYFVLFYGSIKHAKKILFFISLLLCIIYYIDVSRDQSLVNSLIYSKTIGRLHLESSDSDKIISGDNRSDLFISSWNAFKKSPIIGHGFSSQSNPQSEFYKVFLGANLLSPLSLHGIIGALFFFLHYFYFTFLVFRQKRIERYSFAAWAVVTINFFQRPHVFGGVYGYFVIIILIEAVKNRIIYNRDSSKNSRRSYSNPQRGDYDPVLINT